jgi:hypothetical protein
MPVSTMRLPTCSCSASPPHFIVRLGQFGRHRDLLHRGNRRRGDRSGGGFDLGGWSEAGGDRKVFHVDRPVDVQNAGCVSGLAVRYSHRNDHTAAFERLAVDIRFVLRQPTPKHALPQAGLTQADPVLVEATNVVGVETARLERLYCALGMRGGIERGNDGLIADAIPSVWTAATLCWHRGAPRLLVSPLGGVLPSSPGSQSAEIEDTLEQFAVVLVDDCALAVLQGTGRSEQPQRFEALSSRSCGSILNIADVVSNIFRRCLLWVTSGKTESEYMFSE